MKNAFIFLVRIMYSNIFLWGQQVDIDNSYDCGTVDRMFVVTRQSLISEIQQKTTQDEFSQTLEKKINPDVERQLFSYFEYAHVNIQ